MPENTSASDAVLLARLSEALVDTDPPSPLQVAAFRAAVEGGAAGSVAAVAGPTFTARLQQHRRRVRQVVAAAAAAVVALAVMVSFLLVSASTPSAALTRVNSADSALRSALNGHASHRATVKAVESLASSVNQLPPGLRGQVPAGTGALLTRACQALAAHPPPAGAPLPAACVHPPPIPGASGTTGTEQPNSTVPSSPPSSVVRGTGGTRPVGTPPPSSVPSGGSGVQPSSPPATVAVPSSSGGTASTAPPPAKGTTASTEPAGGVGFPPPEPSSGASPTGTPPTRGSPVAPAATASASPVGTGAPAQPPTVTTPVRTAATTPAGTPDSRPPT